MKSTKEKAFMGREKGKEEHKLRVKAFKQRILPCGIEEPINDRSLSEALFECLESIKELNENPYIENKTLMINSNC